jgi:hypothetical protein
VKRFTQSTHWPLLREILIVGFYTALAIAVLLPALPRAISGEVLLQINEQHDTYVKLWDYWYLTTQLGSAGNSLTYTDLLFYPQGTTLAFHNFNYVQVALMWPIGLVSNEITAYNLSVVIIMIANAYAGYVLGLTLTEDRSAALFGGVMLGFNGWVVGSTMQPEMMTFFPLLGAMAAFRWAVKTGGVRWAVLAGVLVGVSALASPYYVIFGVWLFGVWSLFWLRDRWRLIGVFGVTAAVTTVPRLIPMIVNRHLVDGSFNKRHSFYDVDLFELIVPVRHPLLTVWPERTTTDIGFFFLGWTALLIIAAVLAQRKQRPTRPLFAGLAGAVWFALVTLGEATWQGEPVAILPNIFNALHETQLPIFTAVARPWDYFIPAFICFAVAATVGLATLRRAYPSRVTPAVVIIVCLLFVGESVIRPFYGEPVKHRPALEAAISDAAAEGEAVLIVPMGRVAAKYYLYQQVKTGVPLVEGLTARTFEQQYALIDSSVLGQHLRHSYTLECDAYIDWEAEAATLTEMGIQRVVLKTQREDMAAYFAGFAPEATFDQYAVYDLRDYASPCE